MARPRCGPGSAPADARHFEGAAGAGAVDFTTRLVMASFWLSWDRRLLGSAVFTSTDLVGSGGASGSIIRRRGLGRARTRQRIGKHGGRHRDDVAEHRRRMTPGLQEQGVGQDGADRCGRQQARDHVLRAVQQYPHGKATLGLGCNRPGAPAAAARHLVIVFEVNPSRHFSSPGGVAVRMRNASRASASRCCWRARATSAA